MATTPQCSSTPTRSLLTRRQVALMEPACSTSAMLMRALATSPPSAPSALDGSQLSQSRVASGRAASQITTRRLSSSDGTCGP